MDRFTKVTFNSSGSWTCPAGVTRVLVWGMGGGASGAGGFNSSNYGVGGVGQHLQAVILDVVPNTTYTITIGAGGTATTSVNGNPGGDTTFGALMTWAGAPARVSGVTGGKAYGIFRYRTIVTASNQEAYAAGGDGNTNPPLYGYPARNGLSAAPGLASGSSYGGGGGMGGEGLGGNGGNGNSSGVGSDGFAAAANTGAGGGGGGMGTSASSGGAGGSGQMIIMWVE